MTPRSMPGADAERSTTNGSRPPAIATGPDEGPHSRGDGAGAPASPPTSARPANGGGAESGPGGPGRNGATLAQLRRFIKSRPYMPMHELRRRFGLECDDDEVHPFQVDGGCLYVGLPAREARFVGELIRSGEVGYELLLDPSCPLVIGVYAMRPVARG